MSPSISLGRSLLLAAIVAVGIAVAWCFIAAWTIGLVNSAMVGHVTVESIYVRLDGTPVIVRYEPSRYMASQQILSLGGEPTAGNMQQLLSPLYTSLPQASGGVQAAAWSSRLSAANDGAMPAIYWYLVHDGRINGRAYGVGYHSISCRIEGYFGRQGFSNTLPPRDQWFQVFGEQGLAHVTTGVTGSEPYWSQDAELHLLADRKLWKIDLPRRQVRSLFDCPEALSLGHAYLTLEALPEEVADGAPTVNATSWAKRKLVVREPETMRFVDQRTGEQTAIPLPSKFHSALLGGFELADGRILVVAYGDLRRTGGHKVAWLDRQGQVLEEKHVQFVSQSGGGLSEAASVAWMSVVAAPLPLTMGLTALTYPLQLVGSGQAELYASALGESLGQMWPAMLCVVVFSAMGAAAAYRRQQRYGVPHAKAWAAFVFLFGVPGWLAYRVHRTWPALADCPNCRQPAPRHRAECLECGTPFPPPPLKGIEVFA